MIACDYPGCTAQYRRKEHLNRHARKHYSTAQLTCQDCGKAFDRSDTLRRHAQLHRREHEESTPRAARACDRCHASKTRCDGQEPCRVCSRRGLRCTFNRRRKAAEPPSTTASEARDEPRAVLTNVNEDLQSLLLQHESYLRENRLRAQTERNGEQGQQGQLDIDHYVEIYFAHFHSQWPIVHRPSFNYGKDTQPHVLTLSLVMIGLWVTGETAARSRAENMHDKLVTLLENRMDDWKSHTDFKDKSWPLTTFQAIVLNAIFALIREAPSDLHERCSSMVRALTTTCIAGGLFCYDRIRAQVSPNESFVFAWTWMEETQRLSLALFKVNLLYNAGMLSISDLGVPFPDSGYLWDAPGTREFYRRYHAQVESETHERPLICDIFRDIQRGRKGFGQLLQVDGWLGFLASQARPANPQ
ncbi:Zn(II)2Cys6 transcription factor [Aspergillus lucknowensis]|uniref:Uncharacterized protein n=1 Tax=Aspergillus lucknowensis TaxID=176173 RepID=A0ABR4LIP3_9EURO